MNKIIMPGLVVAIVAIALFVSLRILVPTQKVVAVNSQPAKPAQETNGEAKTHVFVITTNPTVAQADSNFEPRPIATKNLVSNQPVQPVK